MLLFLRSRQGDQLLPSSDGINGGLTGREYSGQLISVGIEVPAVEACTDLVEKCGGKTLGYCTL